MSEAEWLAADDPSSMLAFLRDTASDRKLRLFAVSSFRRVARLHGDEWERALEVADRYADGLAEPQEVAEFQMIRMDWDDSVPSRLLIGQEAHNAAHTAMSWATELRRTLRTGERYGCIQEVPHQIALLREIFGHLFRPTTFDPEWRTSTALALAHGIYDSRDFSARAILADALRDAGCDSDDILDHCRGPGPHARGCWVVDLVLGKK